MAKTLIKELSKPRFDAFAAYSRRPEASIIGKETAWYSDEGENVIGIVLLDTIDDSFVSIILGRDEEGKFRAINLQTDFADQDAATEWLKNEVEKYTTSGQCIFPQGDVKNKGLDLFKIIVREKKLNPGFLMLSDHEGYSPAKGIIQEIMPHFKDIDGNFIEQFQTTGFDSRLWELYLFAYLNEEEFIADRRYTSPDFYVSKYGKYVAIEAVTVGTTPQNSNSPYRPEDASTEEELRSIFDDYMPIRFGSPLFSKLKKRYWELDHVKGHPLAFAIADFHDHRSMLWSSSSLLTYLYGFKHTSHYNSKGQLIVTPQKIEKHQFGEKKPIPSGFFFQQDSEHISGVLFSASGTISKFNRMGKLAGFGSSRVRLFRQGTCYDHDPNASMPRKFTFEVEAGKVAETWAEGLSIFHNPNALVHLPESLFPSIAHHYLVEGQIRAKIPEFHPFASMTSIVVPTDD